MSEVRVGALRYDVVMNTASVQDGVDVTKSELKTLQQFFRDVIDPAAEYEQHLENIMALVEKGALTPEQGDSAMAAADQKFSGVSGVDADNKAKEEALQWERMLQEEKVKNRRELLQWEKMLEDEKDENNAAYLKRVRQQSAINEEAAKQQAARGKEFFKMAKAADAETMRRKKEDEKTREAWAARRARLLRKRRKAQAAREERHIKERDKLEKQSAARREAQWAKDNLALIRNGRTMKQKWEAAGRMSKRYFTGSGQGLKTITAGINSATYGMGTFGVAIRAVTGLMTALSVQVVIATAGLALVAAAIYGIYKVLKKSVMAADSFKKSMIDLKVLAGGQFTAESMFGEIREFARNSPYSVDQLGKLAAQMMSFGVSSERTVDNLKMLGEIAGGDAEKLGFLAKAMNDVTAMGRLQGQELRQFANQGFNPLMQMMKETGKSYQQLRQEMSDGLISSEDVRKAIETATSEGGMFYGRIEEGQKTISAQLTKFGGMITELLAKIGSMTGVWDAVYYSIVAINSALEGVLWVADRIAAAKSAIVDFFVIGNKEAREALALEEQMARALEKTIMEMEAEIAAEEAARKKQLEEIQELQDQVHQNQLENLYGEAQAEKEMYYIQLQRRVLAEEITEETAKKLRALQEQVWAHEEIKEAEEEKKKLQEESYKEFEKQMEMIKQEREEKLKALDEQIKAIEKTEEAKRKAAQKSHEEAIKLIDEEAKKQMDTFGKSNKAASSFEAGSAEEYQMIRDRELARREEERKKQVDATAQASRDATNVHLANIEKKITKDANIAKQGVAADIMEIQ